MIVPIEWLKEYIDTNKSAEEIAETFTALGLLLDRPVITSEYGNKILDLEHRMDRADWLSILGCARDFAAMENTELKLPEGLEEKGKTPKRGDTVPIKVECSDLVTRFTTKVIKNVKVGDSPKWLKQRLEEYGITPINNIVDITNYVMVGYGQPLHAQDLDIFEKKEIVIRNARDGETLTTLDGTEINLDSEMFILTQNDEPITLGGIVGGKKTGITAKTKNILLDAGNYNQANIRHTSRKLGIRNETVLRSEKFLAKQLTEVAIQRAVRLILDLAGGEYYENQDWYPQKAEDKIMDLRYSRVKMLSGKEPDTRRVTEILERLGYEELEGKAGGLSIKVPYFRTDVLVEDDIVADFLRISNYNNIKTAMLPQAPPKNITSEDFKIKDELRRALVYIGADEYITNPLVPADGSIKNQIKLENALSKEQSALRTDIKQTLGIIAEEYKKREMEGLLFELGRVYFKENEDYKEEKRLTAIQVGKGSKEEVQKALKVGLATLFEELGIKSTHYSETDSRTAEIYQSDEKLGHLDHNSFTLYIGKIAKAKRTRKVIIREHTNVSTFDISLLVPDDFEMGDVIYGIENSDPRIKGVRVENEYKGKGIEEGQRSILLSIRIEDRNLTNEDIQDIRGQMLRLVETYPQVKTRD